MIAIVALAVFLPILVINELIPPFEIPEGGNWFPVSAANERAVMGMYFSLFISLVFEPLAIAAITIITLFHMTGREIKMENILDASLMQWLKLAVTVIFYALAIFLPVMTFIFLFVAIYLAVIFVFNTNVVAVTGRWGVSAFLFSWELVRGNWFSICFKTALLNLLLYLSNFLIFVLILSIPENVVFYLCMSVIAKILLSFFYVANALVFVNYFMLYQQRNNHIEHVES